ncbi:CaiB/BaiF CoA-transferase family protein [Arthrobacter sp. W4I7]|uniref:CaiB/BaiF CoA transferase family protein n=1 Tax=Arthrobacter sp. W4I7 TaxID=3042296 RepID=UPI002786B267|nr:CoA transferase [Arthrobacter sp. W4I7]MDQ0691398.1 crotonobetainyl-CoA:carnitine CoA-transferase CaiB-like acyl-CoA transferase [Arthrobacter sp. W4I7]
MSGSGPQPLTGLRVLDFTHVLSGPVCTQILGDLGADVIKVEPPGTGESMRSNPPFYPGGTSHYFIASNRNKRSIALDLKSAPGRDIALELVRKSDVVIENFRPGVMDRLGLGFDDVRAVNDSIVMLSISAYGQDGPWAERPGYDLVTQARSGLLALTGEPDGPPTKLGVPMADIGAGLWGVIAVLAALRSRDAGAAAQHLDLSLLDGSLSLLSYLGQIALLTGETPPRVGTSHHRVVPYGRYPAKDGYVILTLHQPGAWEAFCAAACFDDLAADPRFADAEQRLAHRDELEAELTALLRLRTRAEWDEVLTQAGVPFGPVLDIGEALAQEQVVARGILQTLNHPAAGTVAVIGSPLRVNGERGPASRHPPLLGEHTNEILTDLGLSAEERARLLSEGVVAVAEDGT